LHASASVLDALHYTPGNTLHIVELLGDPLVAHGDPTDKFVGNRRRIFRTHDCERLLHQFARQCALDVIDLWDAPQIVRDYLQSGDESIRATAQAAAWAARDAAWAAWAAARAAARAAAWAARDAARAAAWDAAWDAAWAAQRDRLAEMVRLEFLSEG